MAKLLLKLSANIDAAIPELVLAAVARKACFFVASSIFFVFKHSAAARCRPAVRLRRTYAALETQLELAWATLTWVLLVYFVADLLYSYDELLNCKKRSAPRPLGIYAGVALLCFTFTSRLSASTSALAVLMCVKDGSCVSGFAAVVGMATWTGQNGSGVLLSLASLFSLAHFAFCRQRSSAGLAALCGGWVCLWAWQTIVGRALSVSKRS